MLRVSVCFVSLTFLKCFRVVVLRVCAHFACFVKLFQMQLLAEVTREVVVHIVDLARRRSAPGGPRPVTVPKLEPVRL